MLPRASALFFREHGSPPSFGFQPWRPLSCSALSRRSTILTPGEAFRLSSIIPILGGAESRRTAKLQCPEAAFGRSPRLRSRPDIVVWSETAFVPRIYWHKTYRDDPESYELVKDLLGYLGTKTVSLRQRNDGWPEGGRGKRGRER
jgi:hypothetical protein